eukprot:TRINITY_DN1161_c0_g1_i1.p1 TRINITY_DN1161_c0_g1~~TRINITY_DN1161_c0_g1_i1.p1  ORF type:complete len:142 (+),score=34.37 TRINITY_DN1161_c0_g1_i1:13-438(+)
MTEPIPGEQIEEYRQAFGFFDKQKTGRILAADLGPLFRSLGENLSDHQLQQMCPGGNMDLNQFLGYWQAKWERSHAYDTVVNAFRFFDFENSGYVRGETLRRVLTTLGQPLSNQEVDNLLRDAGDPVNYQQFAQKMLSKAT